MSKSTLNILILTVILAIAVFIRSINIGSFGLYGDEKYSVMVVNGISWEGATQKEIFAKKTNGELATKYFTPKQFWDALSFSDFDEAIIRTDNGNSATFYGLLFVWKSIFGQSDGALRWMGVLFDCSTIILIFFFCKSILSSPIVGLLAGFFAAVEPFLIAYSHQVRNYPVGIFLTLLSTYLFFQILKNEAEKRNNVWLYLGYGLAILSGILCHFYVVLFIFSQFIALIIRHLKNRILIKKFFITYAVSFSFLVLWFIIGSGRKTIETFKEKDEVFMNMVKNKFDKSIETSYVTAATFSNIKLKIGTIISDNFLVTNDIFWRLNGKLNLIFCFILTGLLVLLLDLSKAELSKKKNRLYLGIAILVLALFYFVFSLNPIYYLYLSIVFSMFFLLLRHCFRNIKANYGFNEFGFITITIPVLITILAALKSGHTANIYQKYLSFGLPVAFILMGLGMYQIFLYRSYLAYAFLLVFGLYLLKIFRIDKAILEDNYTKYTIMASPRTPNPYIFVADQIKKIYQPGDTVIYPNTGHTSFDKFDPQMIKDYVSVVDAQMTNIYLPKNAEFIQRVEPNEPDKVYLYRLKSKTKMLIFDFEGKKFRY